MLHPHQTPAPRLSPGCILKWAFNWHKHLWIMKKGRSTDDETLPILCPSSIYMGSGHP